MTKNITSEAAASPSEIKVGDFIEIRAWKTFGCVVEVKDAMIGSDDARSVLLQEDPEHKADKWRWYRLEAGEFTFQD